MARFDPNRGMTAIRTSQSIDIAAAPARVREAAAAFDPVDIVRKSVALPGVASVSGHADAWSAPGQERALTLTDGTTARERLIAIDSVGYDYVLGEFTGPFAALVKEAQARFWVEPASEGAVLFWSYEFEPTSPAAAPLVRFIASALWPGHMRAALKRLKDQIEQS